MCTDYHEIPELFLLAGNFIFFLAQNLDPAKISVCNNAIWALGELALKMGPAMKPFVAPLIDPLINVINIQQNMQRTLLENTCNLFLVFLPSKTVFLQP